MSANTLLPLTVHELQSLISDGVSWPSRINLHEKTSKLGLENESSKHAHFKALGKRFSFSGEIKDWEENVNLDVCKPQEVWNLWNFLQPFKWHNLGKHS